MTDQDTATERYNKEGFIKNCIHEFFLEAKSYQHQEAAWAWVQEYARQKQKESIEWVYNQPFHTIPDEMSTRDIGKFVKGHLEWCKENFPSVCKENNYNLKEIHSLETQLSRTPWFRFRARGYMKSKLKMLKNLT